MTRKVEIEEVVTFVQPTRQAALALAAEMEGKVEVHALIVMRGFAPAPEPVAYMVVKKK